MTLFNPDAAQRLIAAGWTRVSPSRGLKDHWCKDGRLLRTEAALATLETDMDRNCISFWFPKLQAAGLPVPRTEIVRTESDLLPLLDGDIPEGWGALLAALNVARAKIGHPTFLRTGRGSGKHQWKRTCYLPETANIAQHVYNLVEWSAMVDFMGLPTNVWAVRGLLPTIPLGVCPLYGDMPVCREFRFFVRDGEVVCFHPYWPFAALEKGDFTADVEPGWYEALCSMPAVDAKLLHELASAAGKACGGSWSVDILETQRGWFITDMAEAGRSFHWPDCPHREEFR